MALTKLKKWLKTPGNSKTKLAYLLNYRSSMVVNQWIARGHIPDYQVARVLKIIGGGKINGPTK